MKEFLIKQPLTCLITEGKANADNFPTKSQEILQIIKVAVETGISLIQIREKNLPAKLIFQLTAESVKITKKSTTKLLVNDRADIAFAANADGVHLTESSIPTEIIRQNFPKGFIIGVSAHTITKVKTEQSKGADFVAFSPIFNSPNKGKPTGLDALRQVCETLKPFPIIALGGIDETNYPEVLNFGASGFAAIRFLNNKDNLRKLAHFKLINAK